MVWSGDLIGVCVPVHTQLLHHDAAHLIKIIERKVAALYGGFSQLDTDVLEVLERGTEEDLESTLRTRMKN
jgi:hypothetical protein